MHLPHTWLTSLPSQKFLSANPSVVLGLKKCLNSKCFTLLWVPTLTIFQATMAPPDPLIPDSHELGFSLLLHKALCHARIHVINNLIIPFFTVSPHLSLYLRRRCFSSSFVQVSPDYRAHQGDAHEPAHTRRNTHHSRRKGAPAACCGFQDSEKEPIYSAHTEHT